MSARSAILIKYFALHFAEWGDKADNQRVVRHHESVCQGKNCSKTSIHIICRNCECWRAPKASLWRKLLEWYRILQDQEDDWLGQQLVFRSTSVWFFSLLPGPLYLFFSLFGFTLIFPDVLRLQNTCWASRLEVCQREQLGFHHYYTHSRDWSIHHAVHAT